jgi:hypothetical protein
VEVDIQSEGPVRALHDRDQSGECKAHAVNSELRLAPAGGQPVFATRSGGQLGRNMGA